MSALFKRVQVVEVFPSEDIAELVAEDVCLGHAFAKGESFLLWGGGGDRGICQVCRIFCY